MFFTFQYKPGYFIHETSDPVLGYSVCWHREYQAVKYVKSVHAAKIAITRCSKLAIKC